MITPGYVQAMARYNRWRNRADIAAADTLGDEARRRERGAFFGSIHGTLSHLLWGDRIWMSRFAGDPAPAGGIDGSAALFDDWAALRAAREATDARIIDWAGALAPADIEGELTWYSGAAGREVSKPRALLIVHMFNHQTHHRGQVHAMLSAAGATPGVSDLPFIPDGA